MADAPSYCCNKSDSSTDVVVDLWKIPLLSFGDIETYAKASSSFENTRKAYKYFAEPGFIHNIKIKYINEDAVILASCHRSMKKSETPHSLEAKINTVSKNISGKCSCVAGLGGFCQHVLWLLFSIAHCKQLGLKSLPDELTSTMMAQRWSIPRGKTIKPQCTDDVLVKKTQEGANYQKFIQSSLYSPSPHYLLLTGPNQMEKLRALKPEPLLSSLLTEELHANLPAVQTKYGKVAKGCVLSYQQKLSATYVINDYSNAEYPDLPLPSHHTDKPRFCNNISICLDYVKNAKLESLYITKEIAYMIENKTREQSESTLWHTLRTNRITASNYGRVAKRIANFETLKKQLMPTRYVQTATMRRGIEMEATAAGVYATKVKQNKVKLFPCGLVIDSECPWLECTPDRKVYDMVEAENG